MYRRANLFYRVLDALFRNQKLVLTTLLCVTLPVSLLLLTKSKGYTAMGAIRVVTEAATVRTTTGGIGVDNTGWKPAAEWHAETLNSFLRDTKEGGFVDHVFQKAALTPPVKFSSNAVDKRTDSFLTSVTVTKDQDNLFTIALNWPDKDESKRLVSALRDQYIDEQLRGKQQASQKAAEFLEKQIGQVQAKVDVAAQALQRYQQQHPDVAGPDQQGQTADHLTFLKDRLLRAKSTLATANQRRSDLTPKVRTTSPYLDPEEVGDAPAPVFGPSPAQTRLADLMEKRRELTTGPGAFLSSNETVRTLDTQIEQLKQDIAKESAGTGTGPTKKGTKRRQPNPEYKQLMTDLSDAAALAQGSASEIQELTVQIAEEEKKLSTIPGITREAETLKTNLTGQQTYLASLREKYNEAVRKANLEREQASLILQPMGDVFVANLTGTKKKVTMGLVSLLIGLVVAGLMVAVREWSDPTLRYESDIESLLDVPVLSGLRETSSVLSNKLISPKVGNEGKDLTQ